MTNESKSRSLSITDMTEQQPLIINALDEEPGDKETPPSDSGHVADVYSNLIGNMEQTKRYLFEIAHHHRSTIELRPDGSILVTPHPRHLPNEIVTLILNHVDEQHRRQTLYQCALATKQLHRLAYSLLWQLPIGIPDADSFERFLTCISSPPQQQHYLQQQQQQQTIGHAIRHLCMNDLHWNDTQFLRLLPHIPRLTHLSITTSQITDKSFQHVPEHCQHLTHLKLHGPRLTHISFAAIGHHCHQLTSLHWIISTRQAPEWLALLTPCPLQSLRTTSEFVPLNPETITVIKTSFHHLTTLDIKHPLDDRLASLLIPPPPTTTHWPQLTTLALSPCSDMDDPTWLAFLKSHPHLRHLDLNYAGKLTDATLVEAIAWLPKLTHLGIVGNANISPQGIRRLVQTSRSPSLASVQLFGCARNIGNQFPESNLSFGTTVNLNRKEIGMIKQQATRG